MPSTILHNQGESDSSHVIRWKYNKKASKPLYIPPGYFLKNYNNRTKKGELYPFSKYRIFRHFSTVARERTGLISSGSWSPNNMGKSINIYYLFLVSSIKETTTLKGCWWGERGGDWRKENAANSPIYPPWLMRHGQLQKGITWPDSVSFMTNPSLSE